MKNKKSKANKHTKLILKRAFLSTADGIKTNIEVHQEVKDLVNPILIEGLPGIGFVGKLAAEHLIS
ncbi:MAG: hypothetical protein NZ903_01090 [Candidatus Micrarchaeota archaeon]|nr:hypothetical protein [Candidatus Micrarchaeota archaeon]